MTQQVAPRYVIGQIGPIDSEHAATRETVPNPNLRSERLLPNDIKTINVGLRLKDYTVEGVEDGMSRFWDCVDELMKNKLDRIGWGGFPISAQLGRERCLALIQELQQKTGLPARNDGEAVVAAMKHLGIQRVAVASRWADQLREGVVRYLNHAGIEVLHITSVGQWAGEAFSMSLDTGIKLVLELSKEAMKNAPEAQGLFVPGGTWRSLGCIPHIEDDYGVPVVTNGTAGVWALIHEGVAQPVQGWGKLLASP